MANYFVDPLSMVRGPLEVRGPHFENHCCRGKVSNWILLRFRVYSGVSFYLVFLMSGMCISQVQLPSHNDYLSTAWHNNVSPGLVQRVGPQALKCSVRNTSGERV